MRKRGLLIVFGSAAVFGLALFLFSSQLDPEWKETKTITLKPRESFTLSLPECGLMTTDDVLDQPDSKKSGHWALVFGVPAGEDSDKYLVGTVLSNPIQYRNELKNKSQKPIK